MAPESVLALPLPVIVSTHAIDSARLRSRRLASAPTSDLAAEIRAEVEDAIGAGRLTRRLPASLRLADRSGTARRRCAFAISECGRHAYVLRAIGVSQGTAWLVMTVLVPPPTTSEGEPPCSTSSMASA